jgi:hypothetical protein
MGWILTWDEKGKPKRFVDVDNCLVRDIDNAHVTTSSLTVIRKAYALRKLWNTSYIFWETV